MTGRSSPFMGRVEIPPDRVHRSSTGVSFVAFCVVDADPAGTTGEPVYVDVRGRPDALEKLRERLVPGTGVMIEGRRYLAPSTGPDSGARVRLCVSARWIRGPLGAPEPGPPVNFHKWRMQ